MDGLKWGAERRVRGKGQHHVFVIRMQIFHCLLAGLPVIGYLLCDVGLVYDFGDQLWESDVRVRGRDIRGGDSIAATIFKE